MTKDSAEEKLIRINCDRAGAIFSKIWGFLPGTTYNEDFNILQLTGTNINTLLSKGDDRATDIKANLDWSKITWDIDGTVQVPFTQTDIIDALAVTDDTLSITLSDAKANEIETTAGYDALVINDTVTLESGFARDAAGNVATTDGGSHPESPVDTSIVVFDLVQGVSSNHDGNSGTARQFDANTNYKIYVIFDSDAWALNSTPQLTTNEGADWGRWTNAGALGSNDQIILVGDNGYVDAHPEGPFRPLDDNCVFNSTWFGVAVHDTITRYYYSEGIQVRGSGTAKRNYWNPPGQDMINLTVDLWTGHPTDMRGPNGMDHYIQVMPVGVRTTQGLTQGLI